MDILTSLGVIIALFDTSIFHTVWRSRRGLITLEAHPCCGLNIDTRVQGRKSVRVRVRRETAIHGAQREEIGVGVGPRREVNEHTRAQRDKVRRKWQISREIYDVSRRWRGNVIIVRYGIVNGL